MDDPQSALLAWYARYGRTHLPWRTSRDPYHVVVSEFMLQQTQVERVVPAFGRFIARFHSFSQLAAAERADVVRAWKGLGYNLRALRLHELAQAVVTRYGGALPRERDALRALPGIGPYTLAAIRAFAFGIDEAAVDVNVRRVVHRLRFGAEHPHQAAGRDVDAAARDLLPKERAHAWNSAMMDLGATICTARAPKCSLCPLQAWCAAAPVDAAVLAEAVRAHGRRGGPQARVPFEQSRRHARGLVLDCLRELGPREAISLVLLERALEGTPYRSAEILETLERDGFICRDAGGVRLR